jgi:hypothetical protein
MDTAAVHDEADAGGAGNPPELIRFIQKGKYYGMWRNDKREGKGTMWYPGGKMYVGDWKEGKREGEGTCFFYGAKSYYGAKYYGMWRNDKREGKGTMWYPDGDKYTGDWKEGKREGEGIYLSADGEKYTGDWKDDKMCPPCKGEGKGLMRAEGKAAGRVPSVELLATRNHSG